jgi:hypothetical protein
MKRRMKVVGMTVATWLAIGLIYLGGAYLVKTYGALAVSLGVVVVVISLVIASIWNEVLK